MSSALVASFLAAPLITPPSWAQDPAAEEQAAPEEDQQLVQVGGNDTKIEAVIAMINEQIEGKIVLFGKVSGTPVTILADGVPVKDVLSQIASPHGWVWWQEDNGDYGLADRDYYEKNILPKRVVQRVFRPNNIKASELERAIKGLLTPNVGTSVADDRTNKLIVNDLPQALERVERFIREIDVQLIVRLFYIRHADVEDIAKKIEAYKSGPGTIEVDKKTHQIIVTDLLSNIKKMELLIDILDVGPEIVIYDVNNIGIEGEDLEDLQKIIDTIRTKDLLFEVNEKQGVMILEDVPEVHERVEQILAEFDKPVRQVLLQSEILSTNFNRDFNFGLTNFALSGDLLDAAAQDAVSNVGSFTNIREIFPAISLSGANMSGAYLSSHAYFQLAAAYEDSSTRVLLQPRLLVKNQETSKIFVGEEVPYLTTFYDDNNNGTIGRTTTTQSTVQSGLNFEVTPSIANSYLIELEIKIDNDDAQRVKVENRELVARDRQNVETTLQVPSGKTRIIGGLITNNQVDSSIGVPFLASLPWIGSLFGEKSSQTESSNLMIFITPTVVEEDEVRMQESGRRGRSVSTDESVAGEHDLQLGTDDAEGDELENFLQGLGDNLLSGDEQEEEETLRRLRESQKRRQELLEEEEAGNYTPQVGVGSTTLNAPDREPGINRVIPEVDEEARHEREKDGAPPDNLPPPAPRSETSY